MTLATPKQLVVDDTIPFGREAFSHLGEVTLLPGRDMTGERIRHADALIVRSITTVDEALLAGGAAQFVGTASTGVDHVDRRYLAARNIEFASAPGSNANAVAEYVLTALLMTARARDMRLRDHTIGIIGVGRIGGLVARKARALGMRPVLHDPPLARATGDSIYRPLTEALRADVVTLHVPLAVDGHDPTWHLIERDALAQMAPSAMLINTSRGEVVNNDDLLQAVTARAIGGAIMDVWEGEPNIHWPLLSRVTIGTPHIAGHSSDGKVNGTVMTYQACCRFWGIEPTWTPPANLGLAAAPPPRCDGAGKDLQTLAHAITTTRYDLSGDHERMMALLAMPESARPQAFDQLRRHYPPRRECVASPVFVTGVDQAMLDALTALGIQAVGA